MSSSEFWWMKELFPIYFSITSSNQKYAYKWLSRKEPYNLQEKMIKITDTWNHISANRYFDKAIKVGLKSND